MYVVRSEDGPAWSQPVAVAVIAVVLCVHVGRLYPSTGVGPRCGSSRAVREQPDGTDSAVGCNAFSTRVCSVACNRDDQDWYRVTWPCVCTDVLGWAVHDAHVPFVRALSIALVPDEALAVVVVVLALDVRPVVASGQCVRSVAPLQRCFTIMRFS